MDVLIIIEQVVVLGILMFIGFIGGKSGFLTDSDNKSMTTLLIKIALPALTLSAFTVGYFKDSLNDIILVLLLSFAAHFIAAIIAKLAFYRFPKSEKSIMNFGNTFSNAGFMGLPFIHALFGDQALLYASIYTIPMHILIWTLGEKMMRSQTNKFQIKEFIKNPTIIAILLGVFIFALNIQLPQVLKQPLSMVASLTSPLAMIILGERLSKLKLSEIIGDYKIYYVSFIKLIVTPIIMIFILRFVNVDPLIKNIIITMQSLPLAVLIVVLSQKHELDSDLASKLTVVTHVLAIFTIPIISVINQMF